MLEFQCPQRARIATESRGLRTLTSAVSMPSKGANCDNRAVDVAVVYLGFNALNGRELRRCGTDMFLRDGAVSMPSTGANCDASRRSRSRRFQGFNALNGRELRRFPQRHIFRSIRFQCPQRARIATRRQQAIRTLSVMFQCPQRARIATSEAPGGA